MQAEVTSHYKGQLAKGVSTAAKLQSALTKGWLPLSLLHLRIPHQDRGESSFSRRY